MKTPQDLTLAILAGAVSIYSFGYLKEFEGKRNIGFFGFLFHLLLLSLTIVFTAANAFLFLIGWVLHVPFWPQFVLLGVVCIGLALFTYYLQPQGYHQKFWRDRYLDVPSGRWQERLYRIIYRAR